MNGITLPKLLVSREEAHRKIQARIEKGQQLRARPIDSDDELDKVGLKANNWSTYNANLLMILFDTPVLVDEYTKFYYKRLTYGEADSILICNPRVSDIHQYRVCTYRADIEDSINSLEGICDRLELYNEPSNMLQSTLGNNVFIMYGHDEVAKHASAGFLRKLDLNPIILDEQANRGQTIIEKFEEYAGKADFAIVLLTPDDVGGPNGEGKLKPRARQNVILELGYFLCGVGRKRVCALYKEGVELPSDIHGIVYVAMDHSNGWQLQLAREMKQAGLPINLEKLL